MSHERILVVDDTPANLKLALVLLEIEGYDVVTATNAEEAMRAVVASAPVMILMDIQLPGMDGLELTRRLKANAATAGIVIIALTAYAMKGDRERALAAGCDGYVPKPINTSALRDLVARKLSDRPLT